MKNDEIIIDVINVYKSFRIYYDKGSMLKEHFVNPGRSRFEDKPVLKGITFKIQRGETVALIGQNGSGKSTTLKMMTKILYPNNGKIVVNGKVSSLIELGAGFHPDMTGRENIYINASILGLKKNEIDKRVDDIIRFSELEEFIDNPIRTYSSGMYMRLAFSVAISVDADILLIDEILAVGDQAFQEKCIRKLMSLRESGTTIVMVSHSMRQVQQIADRCIWIEGGKVVEDGNTEIVCQHYEESMTSYRERRDILEESFRNEITENEHTDNKVITDNNDIVVNPFNERKILRNLRKIEKKERRTAFSKKWMGDGTQGKKVAGVFGMILFMLLFACQDVFNINYDIECNLPPIIRCAGYTFFILGATGLPMLMILLGFECKSATIGTC